MADHFLADALGHVRRALAVTAPPTDDGRLLERFVRDRDEAAFAELVARHGPAVWAACRRGTATAADAEDAFQATFLVLARRADRVRRAASVGGWLFRVAVRLSTRTRIRAARPIPERPTPPDAPDPADRAAWQELVAALDAELAGLPDALRAALVCCYYEGLTQDEAARRLGWKARTVRARIDRGRRLLRIRLARRGVEVGAALAAVAVGLDAPAGMPPVNLAPAIGRTISPAVSALVAHGLAATGRSAWLPVFVAAAAVLVAGAGYAIITGSSPAHGNGGHPAAAGSLPPAENTPPPVPAVDVEAVYKKAIDGCVYMVGAFGTGWVEGSGALIDREKRLVLTTCRVVGTDDVAYAVFPLHLGDGEIDTSRRSYFARAMSPQAIRGRVVHRDPTRDLAVVQLNQLPETAHALELAEAEAGERVLHIGSGTGDVFPMAVRTVEQVEAQEATVPTGGKPQTIQARMLILRGTTDDSGGPLVNKDGRLVGVVEGVAKGAMHSNVTLALAVSEIWAVLAAMNPPPVDPELPPLPTFPPVLPDPPSTSVDPLPKNFDAAAVYDRCVKSCVFIVVPTKGGHAEGSGSLIDKEKRLVLTNYHLAGDADFVYVQFPVRDKDGSLMTDKKKYIERIPLGQALNGKVLYRDKTRDLALVQLDKLPPDTPAIRLAKKSIEVGEAVINIGNAAGGRTTFTTTQGTVRDSIGVFPLGTSDEELRAKRKMVTVSIPINPGDSGGPIIDKRGYLVGVAESSWPGAVAQPVNHCIDVTEVRAFLNEKKITILELSDEKDEPKPGRPDRGPDLRPPAGPRDPLRLPDPPPGKVDEKPTIPRPLPSPADEKAAAQLLLRAKLFADDNDIRDFYIAKLKDVVKKYPNTAAGKEAKKRLDALAK